MIEELLIVVARLGGGAFAGSCLYITVVQLPVRATLPVLEALQEFRATIPRAERMQPPLNIVTLLAAATSLVFRFDGFVAAGALLLLLVVVETVVGVLPINRRLTAGTADEHVADGRLLLQRWERLHVIRTVGAVVAAVLLLV